MNWIDILIIVILLFSTIMGIWRGFMAETLSLLAWVAAFFIARMFSPDVAHWLTQSIESQALILLLSWVIPFFSTLLIFNLLKLLLVSLITIVGLRPVDRLLGAVFGSIKGALFVTAAVLIIQLVLSRSGEAFKTESKFVPHFQVVALWMLKTLDQETELTLDNVIGRLGTIINSGVNSIDINALSEQLGVSVEEIKALLTDDNSSSKLKAFATESDDVNKAENADNCSGKQCEK